MLNTSMKRMIAILALSGACSTVIAGEDAFMKLDRNADGFISAEESIENEALYRGWSKADANDDGMVDSAEFSAFEVESGKGEQQE